jgi:hypothetical protein
MQQGKNQKKDWKSVGEQLRQGRVKHKRCEDRISEGVEQADG